MNKKVYIAGILFGLIAPFFGVFAGLQISPVLGNIFAFPLILVVALASTPIGMFSLPLWILGLLLSIMIWTVIFVGASKLLRFGR